MAVNETDDGHEDDTTASTRTNTEKSLHHQADAHAGDDKPTYAYTDPREQFELDARAQLRHTQDKERENSKTRDIQTQYRLRELERVSFAELSDSAYDFYKFLYRSQDTLDPDSPHIPSTNKKNMFDTYSRSNDQRRSINEHFSDPSPETFPENPRAEMSPPKNVPKKEIPPGA
ncbi:hypothetical protein BDW67DRAFT_95800 [Aspergillus spinulosporus]